jgi:hypothetical protein
MLARQTYGMTARRPVVRKPFWWLEFFGPRRGIMGVLPLAKSTTCRHAAERAKPAYQRPRVKSTGQAAASDRVPVAAGQLPGLDEEFARVRFRGKDARPSHRSGHRDQQCQPVLGNLLGVPGLFHETTLVLTLKDDDLVKLLAL